MRNGDTSRHASRSVRPVSLPFGYTVSRIGSISKEGIPYTALILAHVSETTGGAIVWPTEGRDFD